MAAVLFTQGLGSPVYEFDAADPSLESLYTRLRTLARSEPGEFAAGLNNARTRGELLAAAGTNLSTGRAAEEDAGFLAWASGDGDGQAEAVVALLEAIRLSAPGDAVLADALAWVRAATIEPEPAEPTVEEQVDAIAAFFKRDHEEQWQEMQDAYAAAGGAGASAD